MSGDDPRRNDLIEQINDANNQIDRIRFGGVNGLSILSAPDRETVEDSSDSAWYIPVFVGVAIWIIAVEALVFFGSRWGRSVSPAWSQRIAAKNRMTFEANPGAWPDLPAKAATALGATVNGGGEALVLLCSGVTALPAALAGVAVISQDEPDWQYQMRAADLIILVASRTTSHRNDVSIAAETVGILESPASLILDSGTQSPVLHGGTPDQAGRHDAALL